MLPVRAAILRQIIRVFAIRTVIFSGESCSFSEEICTYVILQGQLNHLFSEAILNPSDKPGV